VQHLGGLRFRVGDRVVELRKVFVSGRYEFYAELRFSTKDETERFAMLLKAIGVYAEVFGYEVVGYTVRLDCTRYLACWQTLTQHCLVSRC